MYVCMYGVCTYVCMYVCMYGVFTYVCMYVCMCVCLYVVCMYVHMYVYVHINIYIYIYIYIFTHIYIHMYLYVHILYPLATPNPATAYSLLEARRVEAFLTGLEIPVSSGFWWHGVVWCYLSTFS